MQFGLYLVKHRVITSEDFVKAIEYQLASRPLLGALAIEMGTLSVNEVFQVLRTQADDPTEMFGELAVNASMLTEDELSDLLYRQASRAQPIASIVVALGLVSAEDVQQHFIDYRAKSSAMEMHQ
jgi:hypothetical protein